MTRDELMERAEEEEMLVADGFDDAIIGIAERCGMDSVIAYDAQKMIDIMVRDGMEEEDAAEYLSFNVIGAYVGEKTPIYIWSLEK